MPLGIERANALRHRDLRLRITEGLGAPGFIEWNSGEVAGVRTGAPLQRVLYDVTWTRAASQPPPPAVVPEGPWIGQRKLVPQPTSNDGIVPAWSQTLSGRAEGIVLGDHLDVIGHYESAGATFLRSGSGFDDARFRLLWDRVGRCILAA